MVLQRHVELERHYNDDWPPLVLAEIAVGFYAPTFKQPIFFKNPIFGQKLESYPRVASKKKNSFSKSFFRLTKR